MLEGGLRSRPGRVGREQLAGRRRAPRRRRPGRRSIASSCGLIASSPPGLVDGLGHDLEQVLGLLSLEQRGGEGADSPGSSAGPASSALYICLGLLDLADLAVAVGQGVLERDVLGVGLGRRLEPGRDLVLAMQRGQDLGEQLVALGPLRLALEVLARPAPAPPRPCRPSAGSAPGAAGAGGRPRRRRARARTP